MLDVSKEELDHAVKNLRDVYEQTEQGLRAIENDIARDEDRLLIVSDTLRCLRHDLDTLRETQVTPLSKYKEAKEQQELNEIFEGELQERLSLGRAAVKRINEEQLPAIKAALDPLVHQQKDWGKVIKGPWTTQPQ